MEELIISPEKADWFLENLIEDKDSEIAEKLKEAKKEKKEVSIEIKSAIQKELLAPFLVHEVAEMYQSSSESEKQELEKSIKEDNSEISEKELDEFFEFLEEYPEKDISQERANQLIEGAKDLIE